MGEEDVPGHLKTDGEIYYYKEGRKDARLGFYSPPMAYLPGPGWLSNKEHDAYMLGLEHEQKEEHSR